MLLTLARHGDAITTYDTMGDESRCLSGLGRDQARKAGEALAERDVSPTHVWCSPLVRAVQTTEIMLAALGSTTVVATREDLFPDSSLRDLFAALQLLGDDADVLAVGHMPFMAAAASELLGVHVGGFPTGSVYRLQLGGQQPRARLQWRWAGRFLD